MAALWEPVGGVFWSTPPAVQNELWSYLPIIPVLLFTAVVSFVVGRRIQAKRAQARSDKKEWHLRQHMVEIGTAVTVVYLFAMFVLVCVRGSQVSTMPLNEVGDFLAGAFGPVAFLWLVLGFLQQGDELRMSTQALKDQADELKKTVEHQATMAAAATQQIDAQREALKLQQEETERNFRANFVFGCGMSGSSSGLIGIHVETSIEIGVARSVAHSVEVTIEPPIGIARGKKFAIVDRTHPQRIPVKFTALTEDKGNIFINYEGADGKRRKESFEYKTLTHSPWVEFKRLD